MMDILAMQFQSLSKACLDDLQPACSRCGNAAYRRLDEALGADLGGVRDEPRLSRCQAVALP